MRKLLLLFLVIVTGFLFAGRLFYLQILDTSFAQLSESNAVKTSYDYPQRGYIFDRNDKLLVQNQPSYDVMVIPREIKNLDTIEFCRVLKITKEQLEDKLAKAKHYSPRLPSVVIPQLTKEEYSSLSETMYKYNGFYIQKRSLRDYQVEHSANVLGYIREVDQNIINRNSDYAMGEIIGMTGIESQYEDILRGQKGVKYIQKDRFNKDIGSYKDGIFDTLPQRGKDITLTIDKELQAYAEKLFTNKRGGIVAIEPKTGEILSLVTAPNYKPELLVGRERSANFNKLYYDSIALPLFDRGLKGEYPPGSPFKTLTALIALQENVVSTSETIACRGGYYYGTRGRKLGCHAHKSPLDMEGGIAKSCNAYFCTVYRRVIEKYDTPQEGIDNWRNHLMSFGLGQFMGYDLPEGRRGKIPSSKTYNAMYPNNNWYATATISNAIGQGEVLLTPMQMANFTAAIANRGWYIKPHMIKHIQDSDTIPSKYTTVNKTTIDPKHFDPVVEGMHQVYLNGTATFLQVPGIDICGKTGTAENFKRIDGVTRQLTDHSVFIAFAPKDDPKIAIAVFVENGYWGARWAGRMASLMIEKYIKGEVTLKAMEDYVINGSLEEEYAKPYSGEPFNINQ
ncbi:penicillin-binding protein 2 [Patiriisocius marinus]|uniref:Penicillin-binding protein 2 n=1 Tax=Patiriisocius marinus TaxID=1397112 RepID=A0A5J4IM20_9FLAO|nr:penicillin-binding protein 2 [Patiriisocius marinus]GER58179.1 penicillin-binding protein 2 [Patiriisocius marinus]